MECLALEVIDYSIEDLDWWKSLMALFLKERERFSSSHYGSEIWIHGLENGELEKIREIINPFKEYFSFHLYYLD